MINRKCIGTMYSPDSYLLPTLTWREWLKAGAVLVGHQTKKVFATLKEWRARARQRRELLGLTSSALKDIGISRFDAEREAAKPFWRD